MIFRVIIIAISSIIFGFNDCLSQNPDTAFVQSEDGTQIGYQKVGDGSIPLVIVHGAFNSSNQWLPVATALAKHCTCYVIDRRGRSLSGDFGTNYNFDREIEDIKAVLDAAGPDAYLLGHSSGAIYALETARRFPLAGLILYEPPLHYQESTIYERIRQKSRNKQYEDLVTIFFKSEVGMPDDQVKALQEAPLWDQMVALAPTFVPEWEAIFSVKPTVDWYRDVSVPTLLLAGTITENHPSMATQALESILPNAQKTMLENYGHGANLAAPELVAKEVAGFLKRHPLEQN